LRGMYPILQKPRALDAPLLHLLQFVFVAHPDLASEHPEYFDSTQPQKCHSFMGFSNSQADSPIQLVAWTCGAYSESRHPSI
ncbi:MAG TPA: hypothetical protein VHC20_01525, partial [Candidatus Paceibacterota bacterium]|nr:hypothetical protein [Candidatus Paceibacterota bacterium]